MVSLAGIGLAIVAAAGLAGQAVFVRIATRRSRSNDVLLVVMLVNVVVLLPLVVFSLSEYTITRRSLLAFMGAGIVGTMLGRWLFYAGIKRIGASRGEALKASMPLQATIFAFLLLGEVIRPGHLLGILLIIVGIAAISLEGQSGRNTDGSKAGTIGWALPLIAATFFGIEPIFATIGLEEGTSVYLGLLIKTISALAVFLGYMVLHGPGPVKALTSVDMPWSIMGGISSTTFLVAYYAALSESRVSIVVPIVQSSPLLVVLVSAIWLQRRERITARLVVFAAIIVAGGVMITVYG